jgi:hypothetical protein
MPVSRRHGLPVSALSLFLCAILVACSQNSHASNPDDPSTAKQGFLKGLFSSTKPVTVPEGTDLASHCPRRNSFERTKSIRRQISGQSRFSRCS